MKIDSKETQQIRIIMGQSLDGGGPKDSENTLNSFLTKCGENVFWQIGTDMKIAIFMR